MYSHGPGGGLPPPPTRPTATHMHSHKPGGRLPLLSARPAVTFPAVGHHRPQASIKLYCLVTEAHRCEKLAQSFYAVVPGQDSNPQPLDRESDTQLQHHDAITAIAVATWNECEYMNASMQSYPRHLAITLMACSVSVFSLYITNFV